MEFRYLTGELISSGDVVRFGAEGREECVAQIVVPGSELAEHLLCPGESGAVILEPSRAVISFSQSSLEDLVFVRRGDRPVGAP